MRLTLHHLLADNGHHHVPLGPDAAREQLDLLRALDVRCNGRRHPGQLVTPLPRDARLLVEDVHEIDDAQAHERHDSQRQSYA